VRLPWLAHDEAPGPYITIPQYWFNKTNQHTPTIRSGRSLREQQAHRTWLTTTVKAQALPSLSLHILLGHCMLPSTPHPTRPVHVSLYPETRATLAQHKCPPNNAPTFNLGATQLPRRYPWPRASNYYTTAGE